MRYRVYDATVRARDAWHYYDQLLTERIAAISEASGVDKDRLHKINPVDFIDLNPYQKIDGHTYRNIKDCVAEKPDGHFLISPLDSIKETAAQISYKTRQVHEKVRASKSNILPLPRAVALSFFDRNHRQSTPNLTSNSLSFGLEHKGRLVAVMTYDLNSSAIRGGKNHYELMRLAIARGYQVQGGASRLQKHAEQALRNLGETEVFSYSNATINNGSVYAALGFTDLGLTSGQPFVIFPDNSLIRLINATHKNLSKNIQLAQHDCLKTHVSANKTWIKKLR